MINRIHRLGYLFFSGYSQYVQKIEKNKDKVYNKEVKAVDGLPKYCGNKVVVKV